jgi:hypothetical protein
MSVIQWRLEYLNSSDRTGTYYENARETVREGKGGTESGTVGTNCKLVESIVAIMRLPLSDAEKAEAVRNLS